MAEPYVVGIDFGAVNIKACAWDGRKYRMIALDSHDTESVATENVILYKMANGVPDPRIGMSARQGRYEDGVDAQDFVRDIKRKLEQRAWTQEIPCLGKELSAEEVATDILRLVYRRVARKLRKSAVDEAATIPAAITVPVGFSAVQRARIQRAAQTVGFDVQHVLTEPFAALFSQKKLIQTAERQNVFVFDFGGSTLDISLLTVWNEGDTLHVEEAGSMGLHVGGLDIDQWIADEILRPQYEVWEAAHPAEHSDLDRARVARGILEAAEDLKKRLFLADSEDDDEQVTHPMPVASGDFVTLTLRRGDVIEMFERHQLRETITERLDALFDGTDGLRPQDVDRVCVFGGTMHIRYFLAILEDYFPDGTFDPDDVETDEDTIYTSVADGAAHFLARAQSGKPSEIENYLPYRFGFYRGRRFRAFGLRSHQWSRTERILSGDLDGGHLPIYQKFWEDEPVYVGFVPVGQYTFEGDAMLRLAVGDDEAVRYELTDVVDDSTSGDLLDSWMGDVVMEQEE